MSKWHTVTREVRYPYGELPEYKINHLFNFVRYWVKYQPRYDQRIKYTGYRGTKPDPETGLRMSTMRVTIKFKSVDEALIFKLGFTE